MNIVAREYVYALISTSYWTWTDRIYIFYNNETAY